jgi:lysophospholipase L1-like esterase
MLKRERVFVLILAAFSLVACFGAGETLTRWFRPQLTYSDMLEIVGDQYVSDDILPFTLRKGYSATMISMHGKEARVPVTINSLGLRGREVSKKKTSGTKRVLFLGDSFTFGVYVGDKDTYPALFENLKPQLNLESLNAGYADGWSPDDHYAWLNGRGFDLEPDVVVYGFFLGNDLDGLDQKNWKDLDELELPRKIVNPDVFVDATGRLHSNVRDMKTVGWQLIYQVPGLRESNLMIYLSHHLEKFFQPSLPKPEGTARRGWTTDFGKWVTKKESDSDMKTQEELFLRLLKGMDKRCRERNTRFLVMMIPLNFQVEERFKAVYGIDEVRRNYFEELKPLLDREGIAYLDLFDKMKAKPGPYFFENGNVHLNPVGNRFVAENLHQRLATYLEKGNPISHH